jgi:hypothetical protein
MVAAYLLMRCHIPALAAVVQPIQEARVEPAQALAVVEMEPHLAFLDHLLLMVAAAAAVNLETETQPAAAQAAPVVAVQAAHTMTGHLFHQLQPHNLLFQQAELPIQAAVAAEQNVTVRLRAALAALASSSSSTPYPYNLS